MSVRRSKRLSKQPEEKPELIVISSDDEPANPPPTKRTSRRVKYRMTVRRCPKPVFKDLHHLPTVDPNHAFVLIESAINVFTLEPNQCVKLSLLNFTKEHILVVDGYRVKNTSLTVSSFFSQHVNIYIMKGKNETVLEDQLIKFEKAFDDDFEPFMDEHKEYLEKGEMFIIEVERDLVAEKRIFHIYRVLHDSLGISPSADEIKKKILHDSNESNRLRLEKTYIQKTNEKAGLYWIELQKILMEMKPKVSDRIIVLGTKNTGKSRTLHFMMNHFVSLKDKPAFYLGCDPGQTEFGPPGVLTLALVNGFKSNLCGSKFTLENHSGILTDDAQKIYSKVIGVNNVQDLFHEYIASCAALVKKYFELVQNPEFAQAPLFVNTMGWLVDDGFKMNLELIRLVKPTRVLLLRANSDSLPQSRFPAEEYLSKIAQIDKFELLVRDSFDVFSPPPEIRKSKAQRMITQIAYFNASLSYNNSKSFSRFNSNITIPLYSTLIHHPAKDEVKPCMLLDLIHHSWVFLATVPEHIIQSYQQEIEAVDPEVQEKTVEDNGDEMQDDQTEDPEPESSPKESYKELLYAMHLPIEADCVCGAFVKSISTEKNQIELIGPELSPEQLASINVLVIAHGIAFPSGYLLQDDSPWSTQPPYSGVTRFGTVLRGIDLDKNEKLLQISDSVHIQQYRSALLNQL